MEIESKGIYEIRREGKKIILTYCKEEDAINADMKLWRENQKEIDKAFPDGVFGKKEEE